MEMECQDVHFDTQTRTFATHSTLDTIFMIEDGNRCRRRHYSAVFLAFMHQSCTSFVESME